jgi:glycosyltransferase involved in cell wall biosynthesis
MSIATETAENILHHDSYTRLLHVPNGDGAADGNVRQYGRSSDAADQNGSRGDSRNILAMFCFEDPSSVIGRFVSAVAAAVANRHVPVHIFSRSPFEATVPGIRSHAVGDCPGLDLLGEVHEFTRRAANAYLRQFHGSSAHITLMGHEWSAIPSISLLHGIKNVGAMLSLHSMERQRSGAMSETGRRIEELEMAGLRESRAIFTLDAKVAEIAASCVPDCAGRLLDASPMMPLHYFESELDPGEVKARFQVGPIDPTIVFLGNMSDRYGPDLIMKAMPKILKKYPQARGVFVGDGDMAWPLRVYSRYLLLDHATRLPGHMEGQPLCELMQAADIVVVPSRDSTPWWPVLAGWAARRPVVATRVAAAPLLEHEFDSLLVEPNEQSVADGVIRLLDEPDFARILAGRGREKLEERCNWNSVAMHIEELMRVHQSSYATAGFVGA